MQILYYLDIYMAICLWLFVYDCLYIFTDVELLCNKLQGIYLPDNIRPHLWVRKMLHRCYWQLFLILLFCWLLLHLLFLNIYNRSWSDKPSGPSCLSELSRLGPQRGIDSSSHIELSRISVSIFGNNINQNSKIGVRSKC